MGDYIKAWQCIGCGKIEAPQTCIGVCQDRKVLLVPLVDHEEALAEIQRVYGQLQDMHSVLSRLALSTPRAGQWEPSYRTLQEQARGVLAAHAADARA
ncbi:MAG: hypothetical protein ABJB02_08435 [Dokdonella sp.]